jgi:hypothetical protein
LPPQDPQKNNHTRVSRTEKVVDWVLYFLPFAFAVLILFIVINIFYVRVPENSEVLQAENVLQTVIQNLLEPPIIGIQNAV